MSSVVAIVETRPETLVGDYARVLKLAGLALPPGTILVSRAEAGSFLPGFVTPPWQLVGAVSGSREFSGVDQLSEAFGWMQVGGRGPVAEGRASDPGKLPGGLDSSSVQVLAGSACRGQTVHPISPLPALGAALAEGFTAPHGIVGQPVVLLPVPRLNARWQVDAAISLCADLVAGHRRIPPRIPFSEVVAESLALAGEQCDLQGAILDGVIWGVRGEDGRRHGLLRHVILAGRDPLAVDAVAARLAGLEPRRIPWMQLCQDRRLGWIEDRQVEIRGRTEFLGLDFEIPAGTFASEGRASSLLGWPGKMLGRLSRRSARDDFSSSAWGRWLESEAGVSG